MVYWSLEPPLAERMELGFGILCSLMANIHTDTKRGKTYVPSDFIPRFFEAQEPEEGQDDDGMAPENVMPVMERFLERSQKRRSLQGKRRQNGSGS